VVGWLKVIPHLKLSPSKLVPVLSAVRRREPDREAVTAEILQLFPNKTAKSVVRGMALPAATRLQLVRTSASAIQLAPNGIGVVESGLVADQYVAIAVRGLAVSRFGIPLSHVEAPAMLKREAAGSDDSTRERASRFAGYLSHFPPYRALWERAGFQRLPGPPYKLAASLEEIRGLLVSSLPKEQLLSLDTARTLVLRNAWRTRWLATSFDVDDWFVAGSSSDPPVVQLWKQAARSIDELLHHGVSYGAVIAMG